MGDHMTNTTDGLAWWDRLDRIDRAYWRACARSSSIADAYDTYKRAGRPAESIPSLRQQPRDPRWTAALNWLDGRPATTPQSGQMTLPIDARQQSLPLDSCSQIEQNGTGGPSSTVSFSQVRELSPL